MTMDLEAHILQVLKNRKSGDRAATFGDLSRQFGVSSSVIAGCARRMVQDGKAEPSMVMRDGVNTLHGLLPRAE
jgi:hypothetical protein